ncbi:SDR family oxidoreductase [Aestuariibaculum suncheonense]|uniref:SDR family oxidoreductase n=1 Tax=Aestuariibaculum suncheonense TaxID=1028745 RepID=A0A8J6UBU8_9FLAO|nr:SDR family oxidoreductase [Aestuariibaculum suncheonense]MBD0835772.1 SDR family oxidoreductase [Aestuariibaculum suncheonense]
MSQFNLENKVVLVTGGGGVLGGSMAEYLLEQGATVIILHYKQDTVDATVERMKSISEKVDGFLCNVVDEASLQNVSDAIIANYGKIDVLINAAGGNMPGATIGPTQSFFDINMDDFRKVVDLNLFGSIIPSIIFGKEMVKNKSGVIINISSMAAERAITRVAGYSASKAAIDNYTKWLAVELATKYGDGLRVNAIAPGFFIGNQNRALLLNEDGSYTDRGNTIIKNTPMKRFGEADELHGALHYLCSDASKFVTGIVIPVDGGFSAFSGV